MMKIMRLLRRWSKSFFAGRNSTNRRRTWLGTLWYFMASPWRPRSIVPLTLSRRTRIDTSSRICLPCSSIIRVMPTWAFNQMNAGLTISRRCKIYNWERKSFGNTKRPSRNWKGLFALAEHRIEKVD